MKNLSKTERLAFMGLVTYPDERDREISEKLSLPNSTFASAKARLLESGFIQETFVPVFPRLGMELLATVYSDFNSSVRVEERIQNSRKTVEVYPEILLSMGESHRGFSLSTARNVTRIMRISHERMSILAKLNLLEIELPKEVIFPYEVSWVLRYFNLAPLIFRNLVTEDPKLMEDVGLPVEDLYKKDRVLRVNPRDQVNDPRDVDLSKKQLEILYYVVKYPWLSASKLSSRIPHSRHTISRVKERLIEDGYLASLRVPDLSKLDYSILTLFHAHIEPSNPLSMETATDPHILQDDTIFLVSRPRELLMLGAYRDYVQYNRGRSDFNQYLKVNNFQRDLPTVRIHSLPEAIWIKKFEYHPLIKETFGLDVV
ncbi:MAG: MarR family transcriptional regulator [Thermoplasmatota archaeon]